VVALLNSQEHAGRRLNPKRREAQVDLEHTKDHAETELKAELPPARVATVEDVLVDAAERVLGIGRGPPTSSAHPVLADVRSVAQGVRRRR